ncbi:MAG TPA: energy transducer TonB [Vicinamibacterales bacterium]
MPSEFLRDVTEVKGSIPVRRISMLPVSIATHAIAAAAFLIIPLAAEVDPPPLTAPPLQEYMNARLVPSEPPRGPVPAARQVQRAESAVSFEAPVGIPPERDRSPAVPPAEGPIVVGGIGDGTGYTGALGSAVGIEPPPPVPPKPPAEPAPVRPGGNIREPRKIVDVSPVYPPLAKSGGVEGIVILEAVINVRGEVERLRVLRSVPLLDQAAVDAVERWRYTPTLLNGVPVPVLITITVRFALR